MKSVVLLATVMLSLVTVFDLIGISLIFPIAKLLTNDAVFLARDEVKFIQNALGGVDATALASILAILLVFVLLGKAIVSLGLTYWTSKKIINAEARFMGRLYRAYLMAPIEYHHSHNSSEFVRNVYQSVVFLFRTTLLSTAQMVASLVLSVGILIILVVADPLAALTCFVILGGGGLIYGVLVASKTIKMATDTHNLTVTTLKVMRESLECIFDVKVLDKPNYFLKLFMDTRIKLAKIAYRQQLINVSPKYIIEILAGGLMAGVILILTQRGHSGEDVVAILALYGIASMRLMPIVLSVVSTTNSARRAMPSIKQLTVDVEELGDEIVSDTLWSIEQDSLISRKHALDLTGSIKLHNISHNYAENVPAVKDVSLEIEKGKSYGLVGRSGAGKTTLANILLGLIQPTSGEILVDGMPYDMRIAAVHRSIGYVPQHIFMLDDTIEKNVAFGVEAKDIDSDAVSNALVKAHLLEFVEGLPDGAHTMVGEQGVRLSGGQRQRIGIARALYYDPDILVFDEATSALDVETEAKISEVVESLKGEKTMVIIAHRLSTIRNCDTIVFMKDGRIKDSGPFDELQQKCPEFKTLTEISDITVN